MRFYELTYLISPELSEEEAKALSQKVAVLVQEKGGILNENSNPLKKKLAYPIKKTTQTYLAVLDFQLNPENLNDFETKLKSESHILRYLIISKKIKSLVKPRRAKKPVFKRGGEEPAKESVFPSIQRKKVELKEIDKTIEEILNEPQ